MKKKKTIILLSCLILFLISLTVAFGRYIYNYAKDYYLETKGFYFNSSTMSVNGSSHKLNNWDGVSEYKITLDVNNKKNDHVHTPTDIEYDITYECSSNVICSISKNTGVVQSEVQVDSYIISFRPRSGVTFGGDDYAIIKTSVTSNSPYQKTLSTEYQVGIEILGFSYNISDAKGEKYVVLELNNAITFYSVTEAFSTYNVGDHISIDVYRTLTDEEKLKCKSAIVTINFDNNRLKMDMLDSIFLNEAFDKTTTNINGSDYINSFKIRMNANSTVRFKFYKMDSTQNYSNDQYIVTINTDLAH